jgi:hypothetical protein
LSAHPDPLRKTKNNRKLILSLEVRKVLGEWFIENSHNPYLHGYHKKQLALKTGLTEI